MGFYEDGEPKPDDEMDAGGWGCCLIVLIGLGAFWTVVIWGIVHWLRS